MHQLDRYRRDIGRLGRQRRYGFAKSRTASQCGVRRQRGFAQRSHSARQLASSSGTRSTRPHTRSITGGSR